MNNFHTHTYRCRHAVGDEKTLVSQAIDEGFTAIGFSEHVPLPYFRWHLIKALPASMHSFHSLLSLGKAFLLNGPGIRMPYAQKKEHLTELQALKKKFDKKIDIYIGFECEYLKEYLSYYERLLKNKEVDYLIFGHHYNQYAVASRYYGRKNLNEWDISSYVNQAIEAMDTGLFHYFAHPDLFFNGYRQWNAFVENEVRRMLAAAKRNQVVLEVNGGGRRRPRIEFDGKMDYPYPRQEFWQIAAEMDCEVIIGLDVHAPEDLDSRMHHDLEVFCQNLDLRMTVKSPKNNFS